MARYEWPSDALYGGRYAASREQAHSIPAHEPTGEQPHWEGAAGDVGTHVAPSASCAGSGQPSKPSPNAPVPVADGFHADWRWFVVRHSDVQQPLVTIQGFVGPHYHTETREMEGASPARVKRLIDDTIARLEAAAAKKRARGR